VHPNAGSLSPLTQPQTDVRDKRLARLLLDEKLKTAFDVLVPEPTDAELDQLIADLEQLYGGGPQAIAHHKEGQLQVVLIKSLRQLDRSSGRYSKVLIGLTVVLVVLTVALLWLTAVLARHV
jgi:hypothetical protein